MFKCGFVAPCEIIFRCINENIIKIFHSKQKVNLKLGIKKVSTNSMRILYVHKMRVSYVCSVQILCVSVIYTYVEKGVKFIMIIFVYTRNYTLKWIMLILLFGDKLFLVRKLTIFKKVTNQSCFCLFLTCTCAF